MLQVLSFYFILDKSICVEHGLSRWKCLLAFNAWRAKVNIEWLIEKYFTKQISAQASLNAQRKSSLVLPGRKDALSVSVHEAGAVKAI